MDGNNIAKQLDTLRNQIALLSNILTFYKEKGMYWQYIKLWLKLTSINIWLNFVMTIFYIRLTCKSLLK